VLRVFGNDYETPDGTCVRDYIHINDLCSAHLKSLEYLQKHRGTFAFNLGNGQGFSVMDIINTASAVTGTEVPYEISDRREGDPPVLVADSNLAKRELGWECQFQDIKTIIEHAWAWEKERHKKC